MDAVAAPCQRGAMDIALIGGHGKVALLAEPLLVEAGHRVEAVIRKPEQIAEVEATGAHPVLADVQSLDASGWDELLRGKDAVIWSAGAGGGSPERTWAIDRDAAQASMDAAVRVGVPRYVMVSYFGAGPDHGVPQDHDFFPYAQAKSEADAHLRASSLDWTILQPSALTLEEPTGLIAVDAPEAGRVSRANVARVIAESIRSDGLRGASVRFNDGTVPIVEALATVRAE